MPRISWARTGNRGGQVNRLPYTTFQFERRQGGDTSAPPQAARSRTTQSVATRGKGKTVIVSR